MFFEVTFDAAGAVDDRRLQGQDGGRDIVRIEAACTGDGIARSKVTQQVPGEGLAGATALAAYFSIEQPDIGQKGLSAGCSA